MKFSIRICFTLFTTGGYLLIAFAKEDGLRGGQSEQQNQHHRRMLLNGNGANGGHPILLRATSPGSLGGLDLSSLSYNAVNGGAAFSTQQEGSWTNNLGGSGQESLVAKSTNSDKDGNVHVRFQQEIHGIPIEGASIVAHATSDGTITAINGELVPVEPMTMDMMAFMLDGETTFAGGAQDLLEAARIEAGIDDSDGHGHWSQDKPVLTVVRRPLDGTPCLSWKRLYSYNVTDPTRGLEHHADLIFADATMAGEMDYHGSGPSGGGKGTGGIVYSPPGSFGARGGGGGGSNGKTNKDDHDDDEKSHPVLCAVHPMIWGDGGGVRGTPTMETYDCQETYGTDCVLMSDEPRPIYHDDRDVMLAHNYAYKTYQYYWEGFGRHSMDDAGMPLISRVHFGKDYNNAFWNGYQMTYGDGDGVIFVPLNRGLDVVAHELTHGVTQHTSNLVYRGQSGALNEAMSDIFSALVEEKEGKSEFEIWHLGEDIFTPSIDGDALRSMSDPAAMDDYDFFPTRYKGNRDNGGVHWNSGIANLAFYLLVKGGTHPQGATDIEVRPIGYINAAYIFYHANVNCLTPDSTFYMARICTAEIFGGAHREEVHLAWDAVGVPRDPPSLIWLTPKVPVHGQSAANWEVNRYMVGPIQEGEKVRCELAADNGDADLFVRFGLPADINPSSLNNECVGYRYGSREVCTTGSASEPTLVHIGVHAWEAFRNLSIECEIIRPLNTGSVSNEDETESGSNEEN